MLKTTRGVIGLTHCGRERLDIDQRACNGPEKGFRLTVESLRFSSLRLTESLTSTILMLVRRYSCDSDDAKRLGAPEDCLQTQREKNTGHRETHARRSYSAERHSAWGSIIIFHLNILLRDSPHHVRDLRGWSARDGCLRSKCLTDRGLRGRGSRHGYSEGIVSIEGVQFW